MSGTAKKIFGHLKILQNPKITKPTRKETNKIWNKVNRLHILESKRKHLHKMRCQQSRCPFSQATNTDATKNSFTEKKLFYKMLLKNLANFTRKHHCWRLFFLLLEHLLFLESLFSFLFRDLLKRLDFIKNRL